MDVLFVGLGSIGTRHLKNLHAVAAQRTFRCARGRFAPRPVRFRRKRARCWRANSHPCPNTPAMMRRSSRTRRTCISGCYKICGAKRILFFIEKPIFERTDRALADCLAPGQKAYVAAPMRWCGTMLALKKALPALSVYSARVLCSSYLPGWRPGVDYRTVYSAHKDMGGGVTIDLIHEWDYLVELFGKPEKMYNFKGTYSHLEIDSDDLSVYIAQYPTLLCEVHLDYFGREYRRSIELLCKNGTVTADFGAGTLTLEDGTVQNYAEPVNERYLREMAYFLDYAQSGAGPSVNTPETALDVLKLTLGEL